MNTHRLKADHLTAGYDKKMIINDIHIQIPDHKISVIIGANACGKSTLLKSFARLLKPEYGDIVLDGKKISTLSTKQVARTVGLLPQSPVVPEGIKVFDLVSRGRYPYQSFGKSNTKEDFIAVEKAMDMMGITKIANENTGELSGGQRQRVWIAMALAQQTDILILDEPTTFLDITYQVEILDLLTDLNKKMGTTILMVLHDINLTARYADYLFAMKDGKLVASGTPHEVITENTMKEVFSLSCEVITDPLTGSPLILPKGRHHLFTKSHG